MTYLDELRQVTRADIVQYVRQYIQGKPFVLGLLLDGQQRARVDLDMRAVARQVRGQLVPIVPTAMPGDPVVPEPRTRPAPAPRRTRP